jgi:NADH-quinone oxidoreductase subunit L
MNRVGDWGYTIGMITIFLVFGSLTYTEVFEKVDIATQANLTLICLALFVGATGKSAQLPLYSWLPDAMEGPTPASALIHAATMVAAGTFVLAQLFDLLVSAEGARWLASRTSGTWAA